MVTFILYLVDPSSGEMVWKGGTVRELPADEAMNEEETAARISLFIDEAIPLIFTRFPIGEVK